LPGAGLAHLPIYGLEDLGFVPRQGRRLYRRAQYRPGGGLPLSTNGRRLV
jgi:hypothetical protein